MVEAAFTRGAILGRKYTLGDIIGEGPTGAIFAAEERFRAQRVAIKVAKLPASIRSRQFTRDTEAAQAVRSENVIFVYDVGVEENTPYVVTEWLEGKNLAELAAEFGPFPLGEAIGYVLQACNGLRELHAARVVHRHIKPSNLFLTKAADGGPLVKLLDVGLSSTELALEGEPAGEVLDALKFASPERLAAGQRADARTDVWSLAVTLYVLVTGKFPFDGANAAEVREAIARGGFAKLSELVPSAASELDDVLARALAVELDARTPSIADFARELEPFAAPPSVSMEAAAPPVEEVAGGEEAVAVEAASSPAEEESGPKAEQPRKEEDSPEPAVAADDESSPPPSVPIASAPPDKTAPGATTAVAPVATSPRPAPSASRRWVALVAGALLLIVVLVSRLGRSPAATEVAPAASESRVVHEPPPAAPEEPASAKPEDVVPSPSEQESLSVPAVVPHEVYDAGLAPLPRRRPHHR